MRGRPNPRPEGLTLEYLKSVLSYDPATGIFLWLVNTGKKRMAGKRAGSIGKWGYRSIGICNSAGSNIRVRANRLAWFYITGVWPDGDVDHKDLDRSNDRYLNLRPATRSQNNVNSLPSKSNTSGVKGVGWHSQVGKWRAYITVQKKQRSLGLFDVKGDAELARKTAEIEQFGEFSRYAPC